MGLRRREHRWAAAVGRGLAAGRVGRGSAAGPADAAHTILTVTDDGGIALYATAAPHGLVDGVDAVTITGCSDPAYNVVAQIVTAVSATTFYANAAYVGDATGGTWALV